MRRNVFFVGRWLPLWVVLLSVIGFLCLGLSCWWFLFLTPTKRAHTLHIYGWAHYVPSSVLEAFQKKEGVRVVYDVFDTTETLEAKLLAARSGYDIVFAPAVPTTALFVPAGVFCPLDNRLLPHRQFLDSRITRYLKQVDPQQRYVLPYLWGTTGMILHKKLLFAGLRLGWPMNSWKLLFDPQWMGILKKIGPVTLLDSPPDIFPDAILAWGGNPRLKRLEDLYKVKEIFLKIKPFVSRFTADTFQDLLAERLVAAETYSTYAHMAMEKLEESGQGCPYVYVLPKEGAQMWIDIIAIPKDAPNKKLAHKFLDFLMIPEVIGAVTNATCAANAIEGSKRFIRSRVARKIYPSRETMKRLYFDTIPSKDYMKERTRLWTMIRVTS